MTYGYIYKFKLKDGRYYIGQRKCSDWENDAYIGSGTKWLRILSKQKPEDVTKIVLCLCDSAEELNRWEAFLVDEKRLQDPLCMNLRTGGNHPTYSFEARTRMSKAQKGKKCKKHTTHKKPPPRSPEHCAKISEHARNRSPETRAKMSKAGRGRKHSPETRAKIAEANRNRSPETRAKMSKAGRGRKHSPETRAKMSEAQSNRWAKRRAEQKAYGNV